jgi:DNA repair photolyase
MKTWNPFTGCEHNCVYCFAKYLVTTRLKDSPKYKECLFKPTFHPKELNKRFKPNDFVFISDMGDLAFAPGHELNHIINVTRKFPDTSFLILSKNGYSASSIETV